MQTETIDAEAEDDVLSLIPASCPMCDEQEFAYIPETGHLICWNCSSGFHPHEYEALRKTCAKVN